MAILSRRSSPAVAKGILTVAYLCSLRRCASPRPSCPSPSPRRPRPRTSPSGSPPFPLNSDLNPDSDPNLSLTYP
eukprot:scaffold48214_cov40-Phaeocystis_antarctica.AAC.1